MTLTIDIPGRRPLAVLGRVLQDTTLRSGGIGCPISLGVSRSGILGFERSGRPEHPETLTTRHNLAYAYKDAGRVGEAIAIYEPLLADKERIFGPTHSQTGGPPPGACQRLTAAAGRAGGGRGPRGSSRGDAR